jgi:hypothetical protein
MVVEKDARQLAGGVNVVVNEPTDILRGSTFSRAFDSGDLLPDFGDDDACKVAVASRIGSC